MNAAQRLLHRAPALGPSDLAGRWEAFSGPDEQRFLLAVALLIRSGSGREQQVQVPATDGARQLLKMLSRYTPPRSLTGPLLLPERLLHELCDRLERVGLSAGVLLRWCDPFEDHSLIDTARSELLVWEGDVPPSLSTASHLLREASRAPDHALPILRRLAALGDSDPDPLIRIVLWSHAATAMRRAAPAEARLLLLRTLIEWEALKDVDDKDTMAGSLLPDVHGVLGADATLRLADRIGNASLRRQALFRVAWLLATGVEGEDAFPYLSAALRDTSA